MGVQQLGGAAFLWLSPRHPAPCASKGSGCSYTTRSAACAVWRLAPRPLAPASARVQDGVRPPPASRYDYEVDLNLREFVVNGTRYEESRPEQAMHGVWPHTAGQSRQVLNTTCTMPTLDRANYQKLFSQYDNNSAFASLQDLLGRRLNARNVFDLALYTSLHSLGTLDGT